MAIYEGARPRPSFLPRARSAAPIVRPHAPVRPRPSTLPRRRARAAVRANRRPRLVGFVLGGIVLAFLLSFFSLVQTVRVSASGYDVDHLNTDYGQLLQERQQLGADLDRYGSEPAIRRAGIAGGLSQLPPPIVLPSR